MERTFLLAMFVSLYRTAPRRNHVEVNKAMVYFFIVLVHADVLPKLRKSK